MRCAPVGTAKCSLRPFCIFENDLKCTILEDLIKKLAALHFPILLRYLMQISDGYNFNQLMVVEEKRNQDKHSKIGERRASLPSILLPDASWHSITPQLTLTVSGVAELEDPNAGNAGGRRC